MEARPVLVGLGKALDVIPGMRENLLLHAGPPITWARASGPMRGRDHRRADLRGQGQGQGRGPSPGRIGRDRAGALPPPPGRRTDGRRHLARRCRSISWRTRPTATSPTRNLNEGYGKVLRYGAYSEEVLDRLRWMEEVMAPVLAEAIEASGGHRHPRPAGRGAAHGRRGPQPQQGRLDPVHHQAGALHRQGRAQRRQSPPTFCKPWATTP